MTFYNPLDFFAQDNPCENCGSTDLEVEPVANKHWRGIITICNECGQFSEYDEPETPRDDREI